MPFRSLRTLLSVSAAITLAACGSVPLVQPTATSCAALVGMPIPTSQIGLPSGQVSVSSAALVPAVPDSVNGSVKNPATPEFCKITGTVAPRDRAAQLIHFQVNLPMQWNGKAVQYGGGGYNGVLVTGLTPLRDAAPADPLPITRGYATFGTDSGHQASAFPAGEPGTFALNDEMLENFAFASYKKTRDVAVSIMRTFYGRAPSRMYYFGGSEGGREGLTMAQRFPADYDGIVSIVPVINWTGLFHAFVRNETPQFTHWLPPTKVSLIAKATSDTCDALDGLADGVVNNYLACQGRVNLQTLRCPDSVNGAEVGNHCLTVPEIELMRTIHSPYVFPFPLANGITSYPGWFYGHEDSLDGPTAVNLARWVTGSAAPTVPPNAASAATQWLYGSNWLRYAIARDANFDVRTYRPEAFMSRVQHTSALMDSTNPDLSAFFARGGKLIIRENGADRAQSPQMGINYYKSVADRLGQPTVDQSARLYVSPGSTHTGNARSVTSKVAVPTMVDLLDPLDRWVSTGSPPADALVQTSQAALAPHANLASRPMCLYPNYPHFTGNDATQASSYACRTSLP